MYHLSVLGAPQLHGPEGPLAGRVRQPRPMALLSVLATMGTRGVTRERLATLLWGEMDEPRARHHLSDALYVVHRELGPTVVVTAGAVLQLNHSSVSSDVHQFFSALERNDYEKAAGVYGGSFLEGFHLPDAPAFEEWLARERQRLAQLYLEALEASACTAQEAGDFGRAVQWWRRLEAQDRLNSRVAIALARALAAAGDRGNATQVLLAHRDVLRDELGGDPGPGILEAIDEVRGAKRPSDPSGTPLEVTTQADHPPRPIPRVEVPRGAAARRHRQWWVASSVASASVVAIVAALLVRSGGTRPVLDPDLLAVLPFRVVGMSPELENLAQHMPDLFWATVTGEFGPRVADPLSAIARWRQAGGSVEAPLVEEKALNIAGEVGAGRLVVGSVTGTGPRMWLTASLLEVPSGLIRVPPTTVEGTYESFPGLVDRLIGQLLARDYGAAVHQLPQLAAHPLDAVQAYLSGVRSARQDEGNPDWFARALELDTTFTLAALAAYRAGEADHAMAQRVWERRDDLSPRDRALLIPLAGWRFGESGTQAERAAQYEALAESAPEWATPLYEWAELLFLWGRSMGMTDWAAQLRTANERLGQAAPDGLVGWSRLFALAAYEGDTVEARRYAAEYERRLPRAGTAAALAARSVVWGIRLRLALLEGDTTVAARLWSEGEQVLASRRSQGSGREGIYGTDIGPIVGGLLVDGRGLPALDRFVATMRAASSVPSFPLLSWARVRGRYGEWRTLRDAVYDAMPPVTASALRLRDALFLGEPEDSVVLGAAAFLERVANGAIQPPADSTDPTPAIVGPARARCWSTLWRVAHGDLRDAQLVVQDLRALPLPYRWATCAGLIELELAEQQGGDVRTALLRLGEIVRPVPGEVWPFGCGARDLTFGIDNLVLAQRFAAQGETERALAAARRGPWGPGAISRTAHWRLPMLPDYLREEGRLAALAGDTAGAIRAYRHYLTIREGAEPPWREEWEDVRRELAALDAARH